MPLAQGLLDIAVKSIGSTYTISCVDHVILVVYEVILSSIQYFVLEQPIENVKIVMFRRPIKDTQSIIFGQEIVLSPVRTM